MKNYLVGAIKITSALLGGTVYAAAAKGKLPGMYPEDVEMLLNDSKQKAAIKRPLCMFQ